MGKWRIINSLEIKRHSTLLFNQNEPIRNNNSNGDLKLAIWAYFFLLIFEGALRKWVLPGLATPLLIIRDPIAIYLVWKSWKRELFPSTFFLNGIIFIGVVGIYTAYFIGHGSILVALFGARILLIHYPVMFVIGRVFCREDVLKIGKATLWISIPMVILLVLQFYSPQSAWVNRGLGGDLAGGGFSGSGDFLRAPTTFSFTNGTSLFFGWLAPFIFYFWINSNQINKLLLVASSLAMIISIPFSISRTLLFEVAITFIFTIISILRKPEFFFKILMAVFIGVISIVILSQTSYFKTATNAFFDRFDSANEQEGGLVSGVIGDRVLGGLVSAVEGADKLPFFGYGLGMGTNVGAMLLTGGQGFLISEGEWGRIVGELGPLMGFIVILIRIGLTFKISITSYKQMILEDLLPWLLLSFGFINILQGGWSQPTSLGFCVVSGGVLFASLKQNLTT